MSSNDWELCSQAPTKGASKFEIDDAEQPMDQTERRQIIRRTSADRRKEFRFDPNRQDRRQNPGRRRSDQVWAGAYDL